MTDHDQLSERLRAVFAASVDTAQPDFEDRRRDFVFHLLEGKDDVAALAALYAAPERYSDDEALRIVQSFLYHAASHIAAAARLGGFFLDAFGSGGGGGGGAAPRG
jgi:hypothetical protein